MNTKGRNYSYEFNDLKSKRNDIQIMKYRYYFLSKIRMTEFKMKVRMFLKLSGERAFDHGAAVLIDACKFQQPRARNQHKIRCVGDIGGKDAGKQKMITPPEEMGGG